MARTVQDLIDSLQKVEDKSQVYVGDVWLAEDFSYESDSAEELLFTPEELAEVADSRFVEKSMGYFYDEVLELLIDSREVV
jgi:hypothetical protein